MRYIVTGTPGTGKTTFAQKYAEEHNLTYISGKDIIAEHNLSEGFDAERDCEIVSEEKFAEVCEKILEKQDNCIIDSHLSQYIAAKNVEICFVCECDIAALKKRLEDRGYSATKVRENLDAEIFKVCRSEAVEQGHKIEVIDTTQSI